MAIAVDASSPAVAAGSTSGLTTAAFTPPSNCILVAFAQADANTGANDEAITFSDSASGSWSTPVQDNARGGAVVAISYRIIGTSPGSMTVTMTDNKGAVAQRLFVRVFTGTSLTSPFGATATAGTASISYTSTVANSWGWSAYLGSNATITAGTATTLQDETGGFDSGDAVGTFSATSTTSTPGSTVTIVEVGGTAVHHAVVEILPPATPLPPAPIKRRVVGPPRIARARVVVPVPPQVNPPLPIRAVTQTREVRGMYARRGRASAPPWPQASAAAPPLAPSPTRARPKPPPPGRRRTAGPVPEATQLPAALRSRPKPLRATRPRLSQVTPAPQSATPPVLPLPLIRHPLVRAVAVRGRVRQPLADPDRPLQVRRRLVARPVQLRGRRAEPTPIPFQTTLPITPQPLRYRLRVLPAVRRGRSAFVPLDPAMAPAVVRCRIRPPLAVRRTKAAVPPASDYLPAVRARPRPAIRPARSRLATPVPPGAAVVPGIWLPPFQRQQLVRAMQLRGRSATPVPAQQTVIVPGLPPRPTPVRARLAAARSRVRPVPADQQCPLTAGRTRTRVVRPPRGRAAGPAPLPTATPPPWPPTAGKVRPRPTPTRRTGQARPPLGDQPLPGQLRLRRATPPPPVPRRPASGRPAETWQPPARPTRRPTVLPPRRIRTGAPPWTIPPIPPPFPPILLRPKPSGQRPVRRGRQFSPPWPQRIQFRDVVIVLGLPAVRWQVALLAARWAAQPPAVRWTEAEIEPSRWTTGNPDTTWRIGGL